MSDLEVGGHIMACSEVLGSLLTSLHGDGKAVY